MVGWWVTHVRWLQKYWSWADVYALSTRSYEQCKQAGWEETRAVVEVIFQLSHLK